MPGKAGEGPVCTADAQPASVYLMEITGDHLMRDDPLLCCSSAKAERDCSLKSDTGALDWQENLNILPPNLELSVPPLCFLPVYCRDKL